MAVQHGPSPAGPADRTLAELVRAGRRLTAQECLAMLEALLSRYDEELLAAAGPDTVVVTGARPTVRAGGTVDPRGAVHALGVVGWFALTGTVPGDHAMLRRPTVVERAGPQLGPILAGAVDPDPLRRGDLSEMSAQVSAARAGGRVGSDGRAMPGRHRRRSDPWTGRQSGGDRSTEVRRAAGHRRTAGHHRVLLAAAVAVAVTVLVSWLVRDPSAAGSVDTAGLGPTTSAATGPVPADTAVEPTIALARLIDARADALVAADPAALSHVEVPDSSLWRADRAVIEALSASGSRYAGLSFTVQDASLSGRSAASALVCAQVARSAYAVVSANGSEEHPRDPGRTLCYRLAGREGGWRLTEVLELADVTESS